MSAISAISFLFLCVSKVFLIRAHPRESAVSLFLFQISVISGDQR
jgi:hypothetical protein